MNTASRIENSPLFLGDFSQEADLQYAASLLAQGRPAAIDNGIVFGIWGDGTNSHFVEEIKPIKGSKIFGLSVNAAEFLPLADADRVHRDLWPLLEDCDTFISRLGAIAFVRAPGRQDLLDERRVPDTVISYPESSQGAPVVQNWAPDGKGNVYGLLNLSRSQGVTYPVVTSMNASGKPEITTISEAEGFSRDTRLPLLTDRLAKRDLQGSFPIIELGPDGIKIIRTRERCIGTLLLKRILDGLPLSHPSSQPEGLDFPDLQGITGKELRLALLGKLGWS